MISCAQYDYIEIACTYKLLVEFSMRSGGLVRGRALDTQYNENRDECIKMLIDESEHLIVLDSVNSMKALEKNQHFNTVSFD